MTDPNLILSEDGTVLEGVRDKSIEKVTIPDSVTKIGNRAFYGCTSLQSIDIPDSVTEIGYEAFRGCTSLQSIDITDSVTVIGGGAFESTPFLNNKKDGVIYLGKCLYQHKGKMPENTKIVIPKGTACICDSDACKFCPWRNLLFCGKG